jgi:hypothetical protein
MVDAWKLRMFAKINPVFLAKSDAFGAQKGSLKKGKRWSNTKLLFPPGASFRQQIGHFKAEK